MKWLVLLFLFSFTLLLGCSSVAVEKPKPEPLQTSQEEPSVQPISTVNKPIDLGHWRITLKPKVDAPNQPEFVIYNIEFIYQGNAKVTHAKISAGNGSVELHDITPGSGGMLGSTFPIGTKKINFQMESTELNGDTTFDEMELSTGE